MVHHTDLGLGIQDKFDILTKYMEHFECKGKVGEGEGELKWNELSHSKQRMQ